jgi:hypothetical protein
LQYPGTYTGGKSQGLSSQPSGTAYRKCCYISPERTTVRSDFSPPNTEYSLLSAWQVANGPDDTCPDFCVPLTYHAPGGDSVSVIATLSQTLPVFECKPQGDSNMVCYTRSCNGNTVLEAKKVVPVSTDPLTAVAA